MSRKIIVITGPTASGKTILAIRLAKIIDAEIICADSRIVYKGLDIVSAKPTKVEMDNVKHHLIDIVEPDIEFSAGDFVEYAKKAIFEIKNKNKNVIVCGGTWFYIKNLLGNKALLDCPSNWELRNELSKYESRVLWEKLNLLDEDRAKKIHPNNKDKIIRALEMCEMLKMPVSKCQRADNTEFQSVWFMCDFEREELYKRINKRVDLMFEVGLYEEWQQNKQKYPNSNVLENTIGYKEFYDLEKGIYCNFNEVKEKIKQHTRNFAKRQLTYFRSNKDIKLIKNSDDILKEIE